MLVISLLTTLSACGSRRVKIEDYEWKMSYVIHEEDGQAVFDALGGVISYSPSPTVSRVDMTLIAADGKITITDITNDKTYEGTYAVSGKNPRGTDYTVTIDSKSGNAGVAMTTYADGTEKPTLPIKLGDYSICFYAE